MSNGHSSSGDERGQARQDELRVPARGGAGAHEPAQDAAGQPRRAHVSEPTINTTPSFKICDHKIWGQNTSIDSTFQ